jgi:hypothetical protein
MLDQDKIDRVAFAAASTALARAQVTRIFSEPVIDSTGHEALRITIVLKDDAAVGNVSGSDAVDALVRIQTSLQKSGEDRLPIVEYATEEELKQSGDSES